MNSLLMFVLGFGAGACFDYLIGALVRAARRPARRYHVPESTVYFGRDDNDHPDDIERATLIESYRPRDYEERYSGMGVAKGGRPA